MSGVAASGAKSESSNTTAATNLGKTTDLNKIVIGALLRHSKHSYANGKKKYQSV
jgi:hypothetical protein